MFLLPCCYSFMIEEPMYEICVKQNLTLKKKEALPELRNQLKRKVSKNAGYQLRNQK